jgi:RNA polymerase sigma-70 factor (ECF subfamily)
MNSSSRYGAYVAEVYGFLAYRLGSRALAEELTEATFARALRERLVVNSDSAQARVALLRIASRASERESGETVNGDLAVSPELARALAHLDSRERTVLALRYGAGLAGPEIAAVLGRDEARTRERLSRGLRRLRVELERDQRDQAEQEEA